MSATAASFVVHRNGRPATAVELAPLAFLGYAHFTSMQVRGGQVRGLDLHLERLRAASSKLFGHALPDEKVREFLRAAIAAGPSDLTLTATVYPPAGEFTVDATDVEPAVLVRTGPAAFGPEGPLSLAVVDHERFMPTIKHVGEPAKTYFLRRAAEQGFDDAVMVDRHGRVSEATIWNLAFWDGEAVVWPDAAILAGTAMGIVQRQLDRLEVRQRVREVKVADLPLLAGALVMNSWTPGISVRRIGDVPLPDAPTFLELFHRAHRAEPLVSP